MIWLLILLLIGLATALAVMGWRLRKARHRAKLHGPIAILGPLVAPAARPLPRPTMARGARALRSQYSTPTYEPFDQLIVNQPSYAPPPPPPETTDAVADAGVLSGNGNGDGDAPDATRRVKRPMDRTLQFLPGRFEVLSGKGLGSEIRFVRTSGQDGSSVTFGRTEGPPYRHIQLDAPTVSRRHARMHWDGTHWSITNLSATNPVAINGVALPGEGTVIDLSDGDRVEMGEVTFRFHAQ